MWEQVYDFIANSSQNPWVLSSLIFITTFILEDAATTAAALLASHGLIPVPLALSSLLIGIIGADLALYAVGSWGSRYAWVQRRLNSERMASLSTLLQKNVVAAVFLVRFIPMLRAPCYMAMGLLKANFKRYAITVVFAVGLWTVLAFSIIYKLGAATNESSGFWKWVAIAFICLLAIMGPRLLGYLSARQIPPNDSK